MTCVVTARRRVSSLLAADGESFKLQQPALLWTAVCYPEVASNKYLGTVSKYTFQVSVLEYFFFFFLMTFHFYTIHSFAHKYLYFPHLGLEKDARDCCV